MNDKLIQFLDNAFKPYGNFPARKDVEQELLANLTEKYSDLKRDGKSDEEAYQLTTESFGDVSEIMEQVAPEEHARETRKQDLRKTIVDSIKDTFGIGDTSRFRASALEESDLADVNLRGADFSMSAMMKSNFNGSQLQNAKFKAAALKGSTFTGADLTGAEFNSSDIQESDFTNANLEGATLISCALKGANFNSANLTNTVFKHSDLSEVVFDGHMLNGTVFDGAGLKNTSFQGATLVNVSFHHSRVKYTIFDGATMDKTTYALLKGAKANLDNVTVE